MTPPDYEALVIRLDERIVEMQTDVRNILFEAKKTNGRVSELEFEQRLAKEALRTAKEVVYSKSEAGKYKLSQWGLFFTAIAAINLVANYLIPR